MEAVTLSTAGTTAVITAAGLALLIQPATSSAQGWNQKASLPEKHPFPHESPVSVGDRIYCLCGSDHQVVEYDARLDRWRSKGTSMPTDRHHYNATAVRGNIYYVGGCAATGPGDTKHVRQTVVEAYDPAANTVDVYDPARNSWSVLTAGPKRSTVYAGMAAIGRKVFVLGGSFDSYQFGDDSVYEYDTGAANKISLSRTDEQLILTWAQGQLESSTGLGSPWTPEPAASTVEVLPASGHQKFFRLAQ